MSQDLSIASLFDLAGKTALVTGGSSGIGLEMARGLLRNGARVIIASRSAGKLDEAQGELADYPALEVIAYLASSAGAYTNGAVIPVDGGTSISKGHRDYLQAN